jgi:hypothetical protein
LIKRIWQVGELSAKWSEQLNKPEDIAADDKGGIYVTDTRNLRIQVLDVAG